MRRGSGVVKVLMSSAAVLALVIFVGAAQADAAAVKITAADFVEDGQSAGLYSRSAISGWLTGFSDSPGAGLTAPVRIPGSATKITKLTIYIRNSGGSANLPWVGLFGAKINTSDDATTYADFGVTATPALQAIDVPLIIKKVNRGEKLFLSVYLYTGQSIRGAKVNYQ